MDGVARHVKFTCLVVVASWQSWWSGVCFGGGVVVTFLRKLQVRYGTVRYGGADDDVLLSLVVVVDVSSDGRPYATGCLNGRTGER